MLVSLKDYTVLGFAVSLENNEMCWYIVWIR